MRFANGFGRLTGWSLLLLVAATLRTASGDQTFGYTSLKPQLWETARPALENTPGTNLYWHDPYLSSWEMCREWLPSSNGCPPSWYGRAELLALWRDAYSSRPYATRGPLGPVPLGTSHLKTEFDGGIRVLVGKALGPWYRVEGSYFGSHVWDDDAAVRDLAPNDQGGIGNLYSPFSNFGAAGGVVGLDYNDFVSIRTRSRLHNGELNVRRRILMQPGEVESSFLMGARYLEIGEQFNYFAEGTTPGPGITSHDVGVATRNKLFGFQIGLLSQFLFQPRCWLDFDMKGGIYQNRATLNRIYTFVDSGAAGVTFGGRDDRDRTAFVGDLSLQVNYQFARHWTFYAGYNAIWVTGIAFAEDNFEEDYLKLTLGPTVIDHSGTVVYHGPNFGLVATY